MSSWREIEAELGPAGTDDTLISIDTALIGSGATRSATPNKVAKALGNPDTGRPPGRSSRKPRTAGDVIRGYLAEPDDALITGDLMLRRGLGGIHPTRVAPRRLRSTLRIFAGYLDIDRARAFDPDLSWYAAQLGEDRDR